MKGESRDGVIGLTCTLDGQVAEAEKLDWVVCQNLEGFGYGR